MPFRSEGITWPNLLYDTCETPLDPWPLEESIIQSMRGEGAGADFRPNFVTSTHQEEGAMGSTPGLCHPQLTNIEMELLTLVRGIGI